MKIKAVFRDDHVEYNPQIRPGVKNHGGGVPTKISAIRKALPDIEIAPSIGDGADVNIVCPLWFEYDKDPVNRRIDQYKSARGTKVLLCSDVSLLRFIGEERQELLDYTDVVACDSDYLTNLFKPLIPDTVTLTEPIDCDEIKPLKKNNFIFSMSQVSVHKNIDFVISVFEELIPKKNVSTMFIGSKNLWGKSHDKGSGRLQSNLSRICDRYIPSANRKEVAEHVGSAWGYISDTKYDTFCFSLAEAMLAGCWCFCGTHPLYNGRKGLIRISSADEAVVKIGEYLAKKKDLGINEEARQYVIDNYSLDVFRGQLKEIIGNAGF